MVVNIYLDIDNPDYSTAAELDLLERSGMRFIK